MYPLIPIIYYLLLHLSYIPIMAIMTITIMTSIIHQMIMNLYYNYFSYPSPDIHPNHHPFLTLEASYYLSNSSIS